MAKYAVLRFVAVGNRDGVSRWIRRKLRAIRSRGHWIIGFGSPPAALLLSANLTEDVALELAERGAGLRFPNSGRCISSSSCSTMIAVRCHPPQQAASAMWPCRDHTSAIHPRCQ